MNWIKDLLEWLERIVPTIIGAIGVGYKLGSNDKLKVEAELERALLQLKLRQNEIENEQEFAGRTADSIIGDVASGKLKP